jgi:hypothetical protein
MEESAMVELDFKTMSDDELINYALSHGEGCGALEEYVKRSKNNPHVITIDPVTHPNWAEQFTQDIRQKYAQYLK